MPAPTYDELRRQNQRWRRELRQARAEIAQQQQTIERLTREVAQLRDLFEKSQRASKRQAAPFSKGDPKPSPQRPGRKAGADHGDHKHRPPPEKIDEVLEVALPTTCPGCGGDVEPVNVDQQFQVEIPRTPIYRQFNIAIGCCRGCGKRVQGRHPLQTSDALGAAASQVGPDAQAAMATLNKHAGLSHKKIEQIMFDLFGIDINRSTSARIITRLGQRLTPVYSQIGEYIRRGEMAVLDETGWRVGGRSAWLHVAVNHEAAYYGIKPDRSRSFAEELLGIDWSGTMIHDGWTPYDQFTDAVHQQCLAHPMRRAREIIEGAPGAAVRFPRQVLQLFQEALTLRDFHRAGQASLETLAAAADTLLERLRWLTRPLKTYAANERLAAHLERHASDWFVFLLDPKLIEATNWLAEQAIRPAVVNRKVWGGNRTWLGAQAQGVITSVIETCRKQCHCVVDFISQTICRQAPRLFEVTPAGR